MNKLTFWDGFYRENAYCKYIVPLRLLLKKTNICNFPTSNPMNCMATRAQAREKIRSPREMNFVAGLQVFGGCLSSAKNDTPPCSAHNSKLYFKFCDEWTYQQSLPMSFVASDGSTPPAGVGFSLPSGEIINPVCSLTPCGFFLFSLTEILEQIVAVSTDLWEICHVSCFKQVV